MTATHVPPPATRSTDEQRWSPRRTLAFIVVSSIVLWTVIILGLRALF